jgi:hypothetical protein
VPYTQPLFCPTCVNMCGVFIKRTINDMGASERQYKSEMSMNIDPEMLLQTVAGGSSSIGAYVFHRIGNAKCLKVCHPRCVKSIIQCTRIMYILTYTCSQKHNKFSGVITM